MDDIKVGSSVVCKDNGGMQKYLSVGKQYEVKGLSNGYLHVVQDNGIEGKCFLCRFEFVKEPIPNGVDAEGNAVFFDLTNLKSWMRVVTANHGIYIISEHIGENILIQKEGWLKVSQADGDWEITEVYNPPDAAYQMLSENKYGELVWKRTPPKTSEQLAQEAAVAARNKAIEEAEKALKMAQEKLSELKGL